MIQIPNSKFQISNRSFTFIDVLIGISLMLIVFLGIFGAYQLGLKVVGVSKNKITATAIANGEIEKIRNLAYEMVGIIGGSLPTASGILEESTSATVNGIEYKIERKIIYISDPADGTGLDDSCNLDYKRVEIKVSWSGRFLGEVKLGTDVAPKDKVQEIQSCTAQPAGILSVLVFDAYGTAISNPLIEVKNPQTFETITSTTLSSGKYDFPLASSIYKVVVSKETEYTIDQTYGTNEIAIPEKPNPTVLTGHVTNISFQIDRVSSFTVYTLSTWGQEFFSDTFSDESKISEKSNVSISNREAKLATTAEGYLSSGYLISIPISPQNLISWQDFAFSDSEPEGTDLKYQILYASETDWILIPDSDLPGNSMGFDLSPVDLSNLATTTYSSLKLKANFSTESTSSSPTLFDWQVSWKTSNPIPIANATFSVQGEKLIGKDANENPVYKFATTTQTDSSGKKDLFNWEWDNYEFSIPSGTGLDLVSSDPPQPVSLPPNSHLDVKLYLDSQNSLLVTVQDLETLEPIFSAQVRLYKSGYDKTQYANEKGQTYFIPLDVGSYNLEVSAQGYLIGTDSVSISGDISKLIKLTQSE
jgi:hypothetical protein